MLLTTPNLPRHTGAMLMDNKGQPYWYKPATSPAFTVGDLETARYHGKDVLVWFEGLAPYRARAVIAASTRSWTRPTARSPPFTPRTGWRPTSTRSTSTRPAAAYIGIYNPVIRDLSAFGGSSDGERPRVRDPGDRHRVGRSAVRVAQPRTAFPVTDSYEAAHQRSRRLHARQLGEPGHRRQPARRRRATCRSGSRSIAAPGKVMWRLGGKRNQFTFSPGRRARAELPAPLSCVCRQASCRSTTTAEVGPSRGVEYRVNETAHTAVRIKEQRHVPSLESFTQGSYQQLPGGHSLVAWGNTGFVTEYDANGAVRFEANVAELVSHVPVGLARPSRVSARGGRRTAHRSRHGVRQLERRDRRRVLGGSHRSDPHEPDDRSHRAARWIRDGDQRAARNLRAGPRPGGRQLGARIIGRCSDRTMVHRAQHATPANGHYARRSSGTSPAVPATTSCSTRQVPDRNRSGRPRRTARSPRRRCRP